MGRTDRNCSLAFIPPPAMHARPPRAPPAVGAFSAMERSIFKEHDKASLAVTDMINAIGTDMLLPYGTFLDRMRKAPQITRDNHALFKGRMQGWMANVACEDALRYISLYRCVLEFEMNRPYENWYGTKELLVLGDEEMTAVEQIVSARPKYAAAIRTYIDDNRRKTT